MENILLKSKVEPILVALGQFIKQSRIALGLSQEDLAVRSGLHRTYISDVERGNRNLTIGASTLIANGLGIDLRDLILAVTTETSACAGADTLLQTVAPDTQTSLSNLGYLSEASPAYATAEQQTA